jgi:hypothetical protein
MLPLALLPEGVAEGDVLIERGKGYVLDEAETARRCAESKAFFDRLKR